MYQSKYSLVLYPVDVSTTISQQQLINTLRTLEFIGIQETENCYQLGEQFLSLLCFMGCSPHIELFPQADGSPYCYVEVANTKEEPSWLISKKAKVPHCPHCKAEQTSLVQELNGSQKTRATCPNCLQEFEPAKLYWRKTAIFTKTHVLIGNIYEAEAIPDQKLLDTLENATQTAWRYAYIAL